jgi:hypothetical protein
MAKFYIVDRAAFLDSILAEQNTSDVRSAIEAVDAGIKLPERTAVIPAKSITNILVLAYGETPGQIIVRGADTQPPAPPASDTEPPAAPTSFKAVSSPTGTRVQLTWTANLENDLRGYRVYRDGAWLGTVPGNSYTDLSSSPANTYLYSVAAIDTSGNESAKSSANVTTLSG